ncbi:MAG: hypothetical protein JXL20_07035 [Deltaproteobacteria bacterium]|nr:hypothetical protein [Deltaproteobacteria bacterium]
MLSKEDPCGEYIKRGEFLSQYETNNINKCKFWIKIADPFPKYLKPSVICNTFLLSMWVNKPNQIKTQFRFDNNTPVRQLDQFQYIRVDSNDNCFDLHDLENVKIFYNAFCRIIRRNKRLYIAQINTFMGCQQYHWEVAFLLFSAAFEALLNYQKGPGVTKRLAKTIACLMEDNKRKRDSLFKKFKNLYNIRSDIMHGKQRKAQRADGNLEKLSELSSLLRNLWQRILTDKNLQIILEADDNIREAFFKKIQSGYSVPVK